MKVTFEVICGKEGPSLAIVGDDGGGTRLAGPKPLGGGSTLYTFEVDLDELIEEATSYARD